MKTLKETVEKNTIFLCIAGSRAYGTCIDTSDYDYRGICVIPDKSYYFGYGINKFEQMDKGFDDDRVIYDIRKFINLAVQNNPNIIEILFSPPNKWIEETKYFDMLYSNKEKFLSKSVRYRFGCYAFSQLKRIKSHRNYLLNPPKKKPERSDFGLSERKLISSDHMGAYQWLIAQLIKNSVEEVNLSESTKEELKNVNYIGLVQSGLPDGSEQIVKDLTGASDEFIEIMMKEKAYINASNDYNAYQDWAKRRNQLRKEIELKWGYDCKHAMHLVRLLRMAMEMLETGVVNVYRADREELLHIRNGGWTYEQIVQYSEDCDKKLNELYKITTLPKQPDRVFIDNLCCKIIENYLNYRSIL